MSFGCTVGTAAKERRLFDRHVEDFLNRLVPEANFEGFAVVALAPADIAGDIDIGQKVHFDLDHPIALTGLAAPAFDVETEPTRSIAAGLDSGTAANCRGWA